MADDPVEILLNITADTRDVINTTIPILPNDIPIILDILKEVLEYEYMFIYINVASGFSVCLYIIRL